MCVSVVQYVNSGCGLEAHTALDHTPPPHKSRIELQTHIIYHITVIQFQIGA